MKRIFLEENQVKFLKEALEHISSKRIPNMLKSARDKKFDVLDDRVIVKILDERYNEILSYFSDDVSNLSYEDVNNAFAKTLRRIKKLEEPIKPQLQKICHNVIVTTFDIPIDTLSLECTLLDNIDSKDSFHVKSTLNAVSKYDDYDSILNEDNEIKKRKLINCLINGGASYLVDATRETYINELFELNEELPHLYSKLMKLNDLFLFLSNIEVTDKKHNQGGYDKITLGQDDDINQVECFGVAFPILLYEAFRGILELLSSQALPKEQKTLENVLEDADILQLDPTNIRLGRTLWKEIFDGIDLKIVPDMFHCLSNVKADKFELLMNNIGFRTRLSEEFINDLIKRGKHNYEYSSFKQDLMKKKNSKSIINDDCFTPEELDG